MEIVFAREFDQNPDIIRKKVWIEANRNGVYASSSVFGMNTSREQGLFVLTAKGDAKRYVVLSKFEESVFIENRVYDLSTNEFLGGIYPSGYKYLNRFTLNPFPKFHYRIENRRIEKTILLRHDENTVILRYTNKDQGSPVKLVLKPIIAARPTDELTREVQGVNTDSYQDTGVVKLAPRPYIPELNLYYEKGEYMPAPLWYHNYKYRDDIVRQGDNGQELVEDLFNPGFFTYTLQPYESFDLYISTDSVSDMDYEAIFRREREFRRKVQSQFKSLYSFSRDISRKLEYYQIPQSFEVPVHIPNYYSSECLMRETLISYYGLLLVERNPNLFKNLVKHLLGRVRDGLLPVLFHDSKANGAHYHSADNILILINLIYIIYKFINDDEFISNNVYEPLRSVLETYTRGTHYNIYRDNDGLIFSGDRSSYTSWMPLVSASGEVLRYGKLLEINAMYYNALRIMELFAEAVNKKRHAKKYAAEAETFKKTFMETFWDTERTIFLDVVREKHQDRSIRLNQIIPLALPFTMLDIRQGNQVLDVIERELLTPFGLRTLSNKDKNYIGRIPGRINRGSAAYYSGVVWPWTTAMYIESLFHFRGMNETTVATARKMLKSIDNMYHENLANIPEILEGDAPHNSQGGIVSNINLTELLRASYLVEIVERSLQSEN
jgi:predicted glycogen debranching enzyme